LCGSGPSSAASLFAAKPEQQGETFETIMPLIARGDVKPAHERTFRLDQVPEAMRHLIEDPPYGKVTLAPVDPAESD
jgi:NADPH:quinone reductase-like Zn-dependent oxidoreductase